MGTLTVILAIALSLGMAWKSFGYYVYRNDKPRE